MQFLYVITTPTIPTTTQTTTPSTTSSTGTITASDAILRVYQVLEEDEHKERVSKELVMLQQLLTSEDFLVFKKNKDGHTEVFITRKKPEIKTSSRQNSDSEDYEPDRLEYSVDSDGSEW